MTPLHTAAVLLIRHHNTPAWTSELLPALALVEKTRVLETAQHRKKKSIHNWTDEFRAVWNSSHLKTKPLDVLDTQVFRHPKVSSELEASNKGKVHHPKCCYSGQRLPSLLVVRCSLEKQQVPFCITPFQSKQMWKVHAGTQSLHRLHSHRRDAVLSYAN